MPSVSHRRAFLAGLTAIVASGLTQALAQSAAEAIKTAKQQIAAIEKRQGGRLGVAVLDTGTGASLAHRAQERFPMCSTFKLLTAAAVLERIDAGKDRLDRKVPYGPGDLVDYAPITKAHVADGGMTIGDLCAAALNWSDNTAANLLLSIIGGPPGFTLYARSLGDSITRLDRNEPTLNTAIAGDERDTTTPQAMLRDMQAVLLGKTLSDASRQQLKTWLIADKVGDARLRAGLPPTWRIGDKTGTGDNATANTIAIMWPPDRAPILATVYYTGSSASTDGQNAVHKEIGGIIAKMF